MIISSRILFGSVGALVIGIGVTACGGGGSSSGTAATSTTTSAAASRTTSTVTSAEPTTTATATSAAGEIPIYQPSTLVSQSMGSTVLSSTDSVGKVSDFYLAAVDKGGWQIVSKSVTAYSASLTVKRSGRGASISIATSGPGTVISISTYPSP
ncbi:MAG: hypothetical protein ACXVXP_14415 [Mycobacteriaceae bacterium]